MAICLSLIILFSTVSLANHLLQALSATPFHLKLLLISTKQQQPAIHSLNFLQVLPLCLTVLGGEYLTVSKTNPCPHGAHFLVEEVDLKQIGRFMTWYWVVIENNSESVDIYTLSSAQSLSRVRLFATPWTPARKASLPSPTPGIHPNPCSLSRWRCQPSHPLSSPSSPALNLSQHQGLFKWVSSSHQVAKVLAFQL